MGFQPMEGGRRRSPEKGVFLFRCSVRGGQRQGRLLGEIRDDMLRNDQVPRSNHAMSRSNERPTVREMSHSNERRVDGLSDVPRVPQ